MIKKSYKKNFFLLTFIFFCISLPNLNNAKEILIYADNIRYDNENNIIANGNAKIFYENQFLISDIIIYDQNNDKIILPTKFILKDKNNNFFEASSGEFDKSIGDGTLNDVKIKLRDGSRLVGKKAKRIGEIDIISKGVYTPCKSRIKIANFICPIWQLDGEKILHDNENLFLYQKHSKMRLLNTPVFYLPYIVTPSPLRKERKSGFLTPSFNFNFFDTKISQSNSFPYYFNLSIDKELTFTPTFNYGGGVDSSQRFNFDYNQLLSGGDLNLNLTFDSNFENQNNNKWLSNASLITSYKQNINEKFRLKLDSALQTSKEYIQITDPNNDLSYQSSLSTKFNIEGYNIKKIDDKLLLNLSHYQSNQNDEDNKTTPIVLPYIEYYSGFNKFKDVDIENRFTFYNINRDKNTDIHSKSQQKLSHQVNFTKEYIKFNSKITFLSELHNQLFKTENKLLHDSKFHTGSYYRIFPIAGMKIVTPFKLKKSKYNIYYEPYLFPVVTPGSSNSNKLSNEDSSVNAFSINNNKLLNRFTGSDKLDNSKRINYGIKISNEKINLDFAQYYEFTENSNYHNEQGNDDNLSDLLGQINYNNKIVGFNYDIRYDVDNNFPKQQNVEINPKTDIGEIYISYLDQKSKTDEIITTDKETFNYAITSKKFAKYSRLKISGLYDLKEDINKEYLIGYSYYDECFGIDINFSRKSYKENDLKPQDNLTLMFSFKNIGSYKSSNILTTGEGKEDINWETIEVDNELFN